jgi:zinc protease
MQQLSIGSCRFRARSASALKAAIVLALVFVTGNVQAELDLRNASVNHLDNGLTVILLEDRNFPVASVQMLYRIGARNEITGKTGLAHFLEHMAFRDSENFPDTGLVSSIYARGGEWHGYTWTDQTTYFSTIPSEELDLLLRIEADRMSRLLIAQKNMEAERGAVLAEMHMYENDPTSMLIDAVMFTSFLAHPYRNNTIGWESDIENLQHEDVVDFYESHYHPANAVLAIVGDIDPAAALTRIEELFGDFEKRAPTPLPVTIEPEQKGERRIQLHGNSTSRQFVIGYRAPSVRHPDFAAFLVLQDVLGSGSGVSFLQNDWGTPVRDDSLLAGAAANVTTWFPPSAQDYIFVIGGAAEANISEAAVEQEIDDRIAAARQKPISEAALSEAITRTLDQLVFDVGTTEDAAHQLAFFEGLHALDTLLNLPGLVSAVTAADVQRIARTWLAPERRTIAWHLPGQTTAEAGIEAPAAPVTTKSLDHPAIAIDDGPLHPPKQRTLTGGIPVIFQHSDVSPSMYVQIVLPGTNIAVDNAVVNTPAEGFTSLTVRRRDREPGNTISEAREWLDDARRVASTGDVDSTYPEARLGQIFAHYMSGAAAGSDVAVVPALIVVSGNANEEEVFALLEQAFGELKAQPMPVRLPEPVGSGEEVVNLGIPVAQAQLGYIVSAPGPGERSSDAIRLLQYVLSHGYEGRLGKEAISNRGLAYYIDSRYRSDGTSGWVTLSIGVDPGKIDALKVLLREELQRLQDEPPTPAEVDEARNHLLGRARSAAQSNEELADELARQWLWYGDTLTAQSLQQRLADVSYRDVLDTVPALVNGLTIVIKE